MPHDYTNSLKLSQLNEKFPLPKGYMWIPDSENAYGQLRDNKDCLAIIGHSPSRKKYVADRVTKKIADFDVEEDAFAFAYQLFLTGQL